MSEFHSYDCRCTTCDPGGAAAKTRHRIVIALLVLLAAIAFSLALITTEVP